MKRRLFGIVLIAATPAAVATTHLLGRDAPSGGEQAQEYTLPRELPGPIVNTHHLMDLFNKPLYQFLREEMQKELGEQTNWDTIADRGLQVAEVMNLVAIRERQEGQTQAWMKHVRQVQQAGLQLAEMAKQQDADQTRAAYQAVIRGCNDCHQTFAPEHAPQLRP